MINIVHYIGIIQAYVVAGILFGLLRNGKREFKYLSLLLLCLGLSILSETYGDVINAEYHFLTPFRFFFMVPNLVYLYVSDKMSEIIPKVIVRKHFIPGIIEFVTLLVITISMQTKLLHPNDSFIRFFDEYYTYLTIVYALFIQVLILKKIATYNGNLFYYFSTVRYKYLNWLKWVCVIFITNELYYAVYYFMPDNPKWDDVLYLPYAVIELGLIYYIAISALLQVNLSVNLYTNQESDATDKDKIVVTKEPDEDESLLFNSIEQFMQSNKPYLNPELNLKGLAQMIGVSERQISNAINRGAENNFYTYINLYRVEEAKDRLNRGEYLKYSIIGIGEASGFNSKSSFYSNFKKVTQVTPSKYVQDISENTF